MRLRHDMPRCARCVRRYRTYCLAYRARGQFTACSAVAARSVHPPHFAVRRRDGLRGWRASSRSYPYLGSARMRPGGPVPEVARVLVLIAFLAHPHGCSGLSPSGDALILMSPLPARVESAGVHSNTPPSPPPSPHLATQTRPSTQMGARSLGGYLPLPPSCAGPCRALFSLFCALCNRPPFIST